MSYRSINQRKRQKRKFTNVSDNNEFDPKRQRQQKNTKTETTRMSLFQMTEQSTKPKRQHLFFCRLPLLKTFFSPQTFV